MSGCLAVTPPSEDPVLIKLDELDRRLQAIERVVQNQSLVTMTQQLGTLERRVDELQGAAEESEYNASTTYERQRELYADLDARIQGLESKLQARGSVSVLEGGPLPPGQLPVPGGSDRDNYQAAFELLKEGRYDEARQGFESFLAAHPGHELAANAQYWLGEIAYVERDYEKALAAFGKVLDGYPGARKAPDAQLKTGYCHYELKRFDRARAALRAVVSDYAGTPAAADAAQRLAKMDAAGQ